MSNRQRERQRTQRAKRKVGEVWCLLLTDEGCPLLTLSGEARNRGRESKTREHRWLQIVKKISRVPVFSVTTTTVGNWSLRLYGQKRRSGWKFRWPIYIKVLKYSLHRLEGIEGYVSIWRPPEWENSLWITIRWYRIRCIMRTKMSGSWL